ncbi:cytochrome P450 [Mycena maculata]|uniref:Cytochrome P450 n=1 Tax=Mycena maculata TaxID=230809 RepID=A0AAD7I6H7_9AGAR|nr:cytochrome P450 [Mycena maculata]
MDAILFLSALVGLTSVLWLRYKRSQGNSIPTVGSSGIWDYYTGGFRFLIRAPPMVKEGCTRYPGRVFRVPRLFNWEFVVSGSTLIDEVASAPEGIMSSIAAKQEMFQADITIGPEISQNPYHFETIRVTLTRNLAKCFPDLHDEINYAFDETFCLHGADWKLVPVLPTMMTVVARTTNRLFVGPPICRDPDYLKLVVQFTIDVAIRSQIINLLPTRLRPILGPFISSGNESIRKGMKHLAPLIEYRIAQEDELGPDWPGKPNDLISWLLETAEGQERTASRIVMRILFTNMAAIHTASATFTHVLFDLTNHPDYIAPLREEAEQAVQELGWTQVALNRMHKIDSFLRESQRMHDNGPVTLLRKVVDPAGFRFSDGTLLPFGSIITAASRPAQFDPAKYEDPETFDGFRFSKAREDRDRTTSEGVSSRQMIATSADHLPFGHKHRACPGRFFAATELKAMLAHLVINYDLRAEMEGVRPPDDVFGPIVLPNRKAKVGFKKRQ